MYLSKTTVSKAGEAYAALGDHLLRLAASQKLSSGRIAPAARAT